MINVSFFFFFNRSNCEKVLLLSPNEFFYNILMFYGLNYYMVLFWCYTISPGEISCSEYQCNIILKLNIWPFYTGRVT